MTFLKNRLIGFAVLPERHSCDFSSRLRDGDSIMHVRENALLPLLLDQLRVDDPAD